MINTQIENEVIFLNICGYIIKIIFGKAELNYFRSELIHSVKKFYIGFIINQTPKRYDYLIEFTEKIDHLVKDIDATSLIEFVNQGKEKITTYYSISLFQLIYLIYAFIMRALAQNSGFILHASAITYHDGAVAFSGNSGIGKSTAIRLLKNNFPAISDDYVVIRKIDKKYYLTNDSFISKNEWIKRKSSLYPLKQIFFLERKDKNFTKRENKREIILAKLLKQAYLSRNRKLKEDHIKNIVKFVQEFDNFYNLSFKKNRHVLAKLIDETF